MNFSHYPIRECPFCEYKTRKIGKHIRNQHPEKVEFVQFGGWNSKKIKPKPINREIDSMPKAMIEVRRR